MKNINIDQFIKDNITLRQESLFQPDLIRSQEMLSKRIKGKSALVIGGAGTIGSSFVKALLRFEPARLFVVDINENGLTELVRDLRSTDNLYIPTDFKPYPINFGDRVFEKIIRNEGPFDIVANFAAHKHVRSEKDHYSIEAMIDNNVLKAKRLLDLLADYPPERFFCVSTDKAANPVNVMGASKKLMEEVILSYSKRLPISTARFANVAFSNGSLLFGFLERLMKRQPFSSPLDIKRYFVSPEESGQLCLLACVLGESGDIFFPKLRAEQMRTFSAIGTQLLNDLGYEVEYCKDENEARAKAAVLKAEDSKYPVYYFPSDTSGEKPYEEFYTQDEMIDIDRFKTIGVIKGQAQKSQADIEILFQRLHRLFDQDHLSKSAIVEALSDFIPTFQHIEKGKNLDQRM